MSTPSETNQQPKSASVEEAPNNGGTRPTPADQTAAVTAAMKADQKMEVGQTWYVVSARWFKRWVNFTGCKAFWDTPPDGKDVSEPGRIDNSELLVGAAPSAEAKEAKAKEAKDTEDKSRPPKDFAYPISRLDKDAQQGKDYTIVPESVWNLFSGWYGGGPAIARKTKLAGVIQKRVKLEKFPAFLALVPASETDGEGVEADAKLRGFTRSATWKDVLDTLVKEAQSDVVDGKAGESGDGKAAATDAKADAKADDKADAKADGKASAEADGKASAEAGDDDDDLLNLPVRLWYRERKIVQFEYKKGERVLAKYKGKWYPGELKNFPEEDVDSYGKRHYRWAVLADEDKDTTGYNTLVKIIKRETLLEGEGEEKATWKPIEGAMLNLEFGQQPKISETSYAYPVLVERKKSDGTWPRKYVKRHWRDFRVGDKLDAKDERGSWLAALVSKVDGEGREGKIWVKFRDYEERYNMWVPKMSPDLAKEGSQVGAVSSLSYGDSYGSRYGRGGGGVRGAVGLRNLGNTCFMNSTLQCMNASPGLANFFLDGEYLAQINPTAYKSKGRIAKEFGNLVKEMWSERPHTVTPRGFKDAIGKFAPQFMGYQQQDSQELLAYLLEGLHEDLNRVRKKPYDPNPCVGDGKNDRKTAALAWHKYRNRENSVIIDNIYGQVRSQVDCPKCKKSSVKFDPSGILQLPFPSVNKKTVIVTLVPEDPTKPRMRYAVDVPKASAMADLANALGALADVDGKSLALCEIYHSKVYQFYDRKAAVDRLLDNEVIYAFEGKNVASGGTLVKVTNVKTNYSYDKEFGLPYVLALPAEGKITAGDVKKLILQATKGSVGDGKESEETLPFKILYQTGYYADEAKECQDEEEIDTSKDIKINLKWTDVDRYQKPARDDDRSLAGRGGTAKSSVTLESMLEAFTKAEVLTEGNEYRCSYCKEMQKGVKKLDLWRLPNILIIQLKRFQYTRAWRDKIGTFVDYPLTGLDMSKWSLAPDQKKNAIYDLYAVSCHGGGLGGGHYWAYCKNLINKKWYTLNDSSSSQMDNASVKTQDAYLLFYARRGFDGSSVNAAKDDADRASIVPITPEPSEEPSEETQNE